MLISIGAVIRVLLVGVMGWGTVACSLRAVTSHWGIIAGLFASVAMAAYEVRFVLREREKEEEEKKRIFW
jgi:heme A synthase